MTTKPRRGEPGHPMTIRDQAEMLYRDTTTTIPQTRESAIAALVEQDVTRWGEAEREASQRQHGTRSYGRALNALANRAELADAPDPALRAAADAALTAADWRELRSGG